MKDVQIQLFKSNTFYYHLQCSCGKTPPWPDTNLGRHPASRDGHCTGRYASYWNAFLFYEYNLDKTIGTQIWLLLGLFVDIANTKESASGGGKKPRYTGEDRVDEYLLNQVAKHVNERESRLLRARSGHHQPGAQTDPETSS